MEQEILEMLKTITENMVSKAELNTFKSDLRAEIEASEARTKVFIENNVSRRMEALFDGYKLTHEKQWELERRMEQLEQAFEDLKNRIV